MIEKMFPQTVSNIIDYDAIKAAAKKYVEDVFVEIVKSFGDNLILQTMDEAHLAEVSKHVAGDSGLSVEDLLSYMNTDNIYRESQFVSDLLTAFPSGVEYLEFEVTGWKFPQVDFVPFSEPERSYNYDGTPSPFDSDDVWMDNALEGDYVNNLLLSRYKGQFGPNAELNWHKKSGRRSSWGDAETWMTTGGFGKPASIHINVDEERTVLEENGLSSVENWLGTVANKLPINLYIEINDIFKTNGEDTAGSTNGYRQSFPYAEGEGFCTNDPAMAVSPDVATVTYTVSYANTQLPDVQIELPESETVEDGYSIILPTMTGEYESGGKTWKPSAWDIGAFGDSYTPNANTVAHLLFEEVETYQEITLYLQSGNKPFQVNVTSAFVGNVNSTYCYQLYTDEACTTPWTGYDYSNDYEVGYISSNDGQWYRYIDSVSGLPDTTVGAGQPFKTAVILLDTGSLWLAANYSASGGYVTLSKVVVRVIPKAQQHYAFYLGATSAYGNSSVANNNTSGLKGKPGISSAQTVPWDVQDATLPTRTIQKLLGSAGNEISQTGVGWRDPSLGYNFYQLANNSGVSISLRAVVFTLSTPTSYCYPNNINTDTTINSSTNYQMFDADGDNIPYESNVEYRVIGMFKANGDATTNTWSNLNAMQLFGNASNNLCLKYTGNGTLTFYKVWYIKTPLT